VCRLSSAIAGNTLRCGRPAGYAIYDVQLGGASDGGDYGGADGDDDDDGDGGGSGGGDDDDDDDVGGGDGDGDGDGDDGDDDAGSIPSASPREFDITGCGCTCAHGRTGGGAGPSPPSRRQSVPLGPFATLILSHADFHLTGFDHDHVTAATVAAAAAATCYLECSRRFAADRNAKRWSDRLMFMFSRAIMISC